MPFSDTGVHCLVALFDFSIYIFWWQSQTSVNVATCPAPSEVCEDVQGVRRTVVRLAGVYWAYCKQELFCEKKKKKFNPQSL